MLVLVGGGMNMDLFWRSQQANALVSSHVGTDGDELTLEVDPAICAIKVISTKGIRA